MRPWVGRMRRERLPLTQSQMLLSGICVGRGLAVARSVVRNKKRLIRRSTPFQLPFPLRPTNSTAGSRQNGESISPLRSTEYCD